MQFQLIKTDTETKARAGTIATGHGDIPTPIFMPVGTAGSVKAVHQRELEHDIDAKIILGNTYHLYLRPGIGLLEKAGGLHRFNGWKRPILSDSGGYQVYSLSENRKINEEGVTFKSHIDGSKHFFTPEIAIDIQRAIGADIIMAFDECTPYPCGHAYAKQSMELTHRWLLRCAGRMKGTQPKYGYGQALFPIVQGSTYKDLRQQSAEFVAAQDLPGNAIGGLSVGEPPEEMYRCTEQVCGILPTGKPRYLMGVGTPENILECIALGIDMFDCVMPTRNARNGMLFTSEGIINIRNEKWKNDLSPIDASLEGHTSNFYSKAYLRHLIINKEILGAQIASIHNLTFYLWLVKTARERILEGNFLNWKTQMAKKTSQRL
ncbi:MAG: tRNA guanosine(34) transglycosylase Tgt [Cyclobacteriaceae bacterium]|nr:tRNA guanosine(34) transglycosylase Tgt [Cyclobacteriaceae bacterium]MCB0499113.1 tRNA guanosine(34) transglycosylase Tgt [Cyclobacteriaceae bacterium]MCB9238389.1 tRNA guanosine(34) transglycosylase Tgt [Flammeovirgaceae bacterium]MCO5272071.1 tRNA guanosine(34) transglycosylase Tgt [Cyclobacteriaceae bacterium]MCW5902893.1 tRNA guanosine(34) transglycosylase Tgt [Cyclobacteriaceae bacterium]